MGFHFAVFSGSVARPPVGLESPLAAALHRGTSFFAEDHDELERTLDVRPRLPQQSPGHEHCARL